MLYEDRKRLLDKKIEALAESYNVSKFGKKEEDRVTHVEISGIQVTQPRRTIAEIVSHMFHISQNNDHNRRESGLQK